MSTPRTLIAALAAVLALGGLAHAAGTETSDEDESAYGAGMEAADSGDWDEAISLFGNAVAMDPQDADALNMLAYSYRQSGDLENAFANYQKALAVDPEHKNAHEYIGEAYLQAGDLAGAQKHLAVLEDLCPSGCEQKDALEEAIAAYDAGD